MHCDRCNVDFPEGLRYCKWCGEALADRPRITSELHTCPSCSAAVQPGWAFCKLCGERLRTGSTGPVCLACGTQNEADAHNCVRCGQELGSGRARKTPAEPSDASAISKCTSCGERLDTGSLYCKGCGSAVYSEPTPFGGSALLCGACNSYSPLGSRSCRVCGAALIQGSRTVVDFPAGVTTVQQKAPTLPDLDERINEQPSEQELPSDSGANTFIFTPSDLESGPSIQKGTAETNMLTGTAGAKSEQQAPTAVMNMGRITGPVEPEEAQGASTPSGELANAPSPGAEFGTPAIDAPPVVGNEPTVEFAAVAQPPAAPGPTTLGLASDSQSDDAPAGSENKTAIFVSPAQGPTLASRDQSSHDDIGTVRITPATPSTGVEPTREIQQPARGVTADHVAATGKMTGIPKPTTTERMEPAVAQTFTQPDVREPSVGEVISQPLPKKRTGVVVATVVVLLLLLVGAGYVGWLLFGRGRPAQTTPPSVAVEQPPVAPPPAVPEKPPVPVVPEGMVAVSGGTYTIGRDGADPLEQPEHKVDLAPFFIDRTEVTNAAYKNFVDSTGHKPPSNWVGNTFPEARGDAPVTGVTWQDAADYAAWAGKRLPSEVEWESAARGAEGRIYPWGNGWRSGVANIGQKPDKITADQYPAGIKEVGRYPEGASPFGAVDLVGNAWEWVADEIKVYPGNTESKLELESGATFRVIRGGAYDGSKVNDATYRGYLDGGQAYPKVGFRCAKDAK